MPQSLAKIWIHLIFSTKERFPFLRTESLRKEMHAYLAGICQELGSTPAQIGGAADHVHILCTLPKSTAASDLVRSLKRSSSKWIKGKGAVLAKFYWQSGYGVFSVSPSQVKAVRDYIGNQAEHHRTVSFQDEFRSFLRKYEIEHDERYLWD